MVKDTSQLQCLWDATLEAAFDVQK
jgi:hypothetical protein